MRLSYFPSRYHSLARAAKDYISILKSQVAFAPSANTDIVILHCLPFEFDEIIQFYPQILNKYTIACCLWEATDLPTYFKQFLPKVREVWTCSEYCHNVFAKYHANVQLVPFVIDRDKGYSESDLATVKALISFNPDLTYFLTLTSLLDKRKNAATLVRLFSRLSTAMPDARLILKTLPIQDDPATSTEGNVIYIHHQLTHAEMNALYHLSSIYLSAHHAEGWGFTISDAMLFDRPVIATGYSGNMQFMTDTNSYPVEYNEEYIHEDDRFYLFDYPMKWGYPDVEDLAEKCRWMYRNRDDSAVGAKVERARVDVARFSKSEVSNAIISHIRRIGASL